MLLTVNQATLEGRTVLAVTVRKWQQTVSGAVSLVS